EREERDATCPAAAAAEPRTPFNGALRNEGRGRRSRGIRATPIPVVVLHLLGCSNLGQLLLLHCDRRHGRAKKSSRRQPTPKAEHARVSKGTVREEACALRPDTSTGCITDEFDWFVCCVASLIGCVE